MKNINRMFLHYPVGVLTASLIYVSAPLGVLFGIGFLAYEITQGSDPHKDIEGWLWGLCWTGLLWIIFHFMGLVV